MKTPVNKSQKSKGQYIESKASSRQNGGENLLQFIDNRPEAIIQMNLYNIANNRQQINIPGYNLQTYGNRLSQESQPIQKVEEEIPPHRLEKHVQVPSKEDWTAHDKK